MEYLKQNENLEESLRLSRVTVAFLALLLLLTVVILPGSVRRSNPVLVQSESGFALANVEPWRLSSVRMDAFTKAFLSARFEWSEDSFPEVKKTLSEFVDAAVLEKLKDSVQAYEGLARNQKAHCYFVLESPPIYDNEHSKIEAHVTRVLRIQNTVLATPLIIEFSYASAPITAENPYGLKVISLSESEVGGN